jgi:hypothetical protein
MRHRKQARADEADTEESLDTTQQYDMADVTKDTENILEWLHSNHDDVAMKVDPGMLITGVHTTDTVFRTSFEDSKTIY